MTNPNEPWQGQPGGPPPPNEPTAQFGNPGAPQHTSNPYEAYGQAGPNPTQSFPTAGPYGAYPTDEGSANPYGADPYNPTPGATYQYGPPGQVPPGQFQPPYQQQPPQKPKRTGLWIAIAGVVALLLVGGVAAAVLLGGSDSSDTATGTSSARTTNPKSGSKTPPSIALPTDLSFPSLSLPNLPDLGGIGVEIGSITSVSGDTIVIDSTDGKPKTIHTSSSTKVIGLSANKVSDLKTGDSIVANGTSRSDGSLDADTIFATGIHIN
ncbi:hypothetical protein [Antrihabitans stalactiti]|uniref:DUF5666 domain-containing protein n=1 Tax=Antrihabitans stalactiti TaxID=2584121 RepID=A0A848KSA7_9NOCA|nr:hypothetical protein [Antrihabitans stalactiti]NMN99140.1 hypothetical protein [Antrihabitans stalactiti]